MPQKLVTVSGNFSEVGQVIQLDIPNHATEVAFRLHRLGAEIEIVFIIEGDVQSTHPRRFQMLGDEHLPDNFIKYIGQFPFQGDDVVFIVEVGVQ